MKKTLIVLEGLDGCGKTTQMGQLCQFFKIQGLGFKRIKLPDYSSRSSELVKMYLAGEFGENAISVNPYAASLFYSADRFASFDTDWGNDYNNGLIILADRYTTSNIIYQMPKLIPSDWDSYISWLEDMEYNKLGLPKPDLTIYLDVTPEASQILLQHRYMGDEAKKDIHEKDMEYLLKCRESALYASDKCGWTIIPCGNSIDGLREICDISNDIKKVVSNIL